MTTTHIMKRLVVFSSFALIAIAAVLGLGATGYAAIIQWDGGGANTNWNTGFNWVSNTAPSSSASNHLEFGTVVLQAPGQTTANNNIAANFQLNELTFGNTAVASFNLTGSSIQFRKDGPLDSQIVQNSNQAQTIGVGISLQNGNFSLEGNGTGVVTISGVVSGIAIAKNGTSTYLLTGDNNALNGNTTINGGTIIVGHANALDTNTVTVNNTATLAIASGITYTSPITLNSGSTLAGKGTYTPSAATLTIGNGVNVTPGIADIGTLSIGKNTTFAAGSIFNVSVGAGANNNDRLNVTGTLNTGAANTLNLSMSGANQGKYTLASATSALSIGSNTSANGGFGSVTGLNSAYRLNTTSTAIELIHKATVAIDATPAFSSIITGGSTSISGHVANIAPLNSDALTYTLSGSTGVSGLPGGTLNRTAGDANAAAGALFTGSFTSATLGLNNVQLTATGTVASTVTNSPQSASFNVNVLDHASGSLVGSSTNIGNVIVGASIADASFNLNNAAGTRAGLRLTGVTSSNSTLTGPTLIAALAAGGSQGYSASINTGSVGALVASHIFDVEDEALPGATNLPNLTYNITGNVLDHASGSLVGSSTNIGNVIVGASLADATFNLENAAGFRAGLRLTGVTSSNSTLIGPTLIAALAAGGSQGYSASIDTSTVGAYAASHTFDVEDEALPGAIDLPSLTYDINGDVLAHSNASFASVIDVDSMLIDFGTVAQGAGGGLLNSLFEVYNLVDLLGYTASLDLDTLAMSGDVATLAITGLGAFTNLAAGTYHNYFIDFDTNTPGTFSATYTFKLSDDNLPGASAPESQVLTLTVTGTVENNVPEPAAMGLMLLGSALFAAVRRNRMA